MVLAAWPASAAVKVWTSATGGNWNDSARWTGGVPGAGDDAQFTAAGGPYTVIVTPGSVAQSLGVLGGRVVYTSSGSYLTVGGLLTVQNAAQAEARFLGGAATFNGTGTHTIGGNGSNSVSNVVGTLIVDDADLSFPNNGSGRIRVGEGTGTRGTLRILNGGTVTSAGRVVLADENNSSGTIEVSGRGSRLVINGSSFNGQLAIGDGQVTAANPDSTMTVSGGGYVESDIAFISAFSLAAGQVVSPGRAEVTVGGADAFGTPATWKTRGYLEIGGTTGGRRAEGVVNLTDGGRIEVGSYLRLFRHEFTSSALNVSGGTLQAQTLDLGAATMFFNPGFTFTGGTITVDGGTFTSPQDGLDIIGPPSTGVRPHLRLINGATHASPTTSLTVGNTDGGLGRLTITGGSTMLFDGVSVAGGFDNGPADTNPRLNPAVPSDLDVLTGASLLTVHGAGSRLTTVDGLTVGTGGRLDVLGGARINVGDPNEPFSSANLTNFGVIYIGAGSRIEITGTYSHQEGAIIRGDGEIIIDSGFASGPGFSGAFAVTITGSYTYGQGTAAKIGGLRFITNNSPTVTLQSDFDGGEAPSLKLIGDVSFTGTAGTPAITQDVAGTLDLGFDQAASPRTFTINDGSAAVDMEVSTKVSNGQLRKGGAGVLRLTHAANDHARTILALGKLQVGPGGIGSGDAAFEGGTLWLTTGFDGAGNVNAATGSAAFANAADATAGSGTIELGPGGNPGPQAFEMGAWRLGEGLQLSVTGASNATLRFNGAGTLTGTGTINNAVALTLAGAIGQSGAGRGLTKNGAGTLTMTGSAANTYTGLTRVQAGTLLLDKAGGAVAIPGNLEALAGTVRLLRAEQIANAASVTLSNAGTTLDLNNLAETVGSLSVNANARLAGRGSLTAGGAVTTATGGGISAQGGTLRVSAASIANGGVLEAQGGATLELLAGAVSGAGSINVASGGTIISSVPIGIASGGTLSLGGSAKLDLKDQDLAWAGTAGTRAARLDSLTGMLMQARNAGPAGPWSGNGLTSSTAAAHPTKLTALGVAVNEGPTPGQPLHATFSGIAVDANSVLVKYTYYGDANLNGRVEAGDYFLVDRGRALGRTGWANGDFNYSGGVATIDDYLLMDTSFLRQGAPLTSSWAGPGVGGAAATAAVPEPGAAAAALAVAATGLLQRRRRRGGCP